MERVLAEIGAAQVPQILVFNKLDQVEPLPRVLQDWVERPGADAVPRVFVSALRGTGLDALRALIAQVAASGGLNPPGQTPSDGLSETPADPDTTQTPAGVQLPSAMT